MRYQAAVELAPEDPLAASRLARTRYAQGRIGEAIELMSAKLPLDPRDHEGPLVMVQFYLELGMTDAALPWLEAAERMAPEATTTHLFRAMWHWRRGEHGEAAAISAAALEAGLPDRWASRLKFGFMVTMHQQAQGRYERSLAMLLELAPTALDPLGPDEPVIPRLSSRRSMPCRSSGCGTGRPRRVRGRPSCWRTWSEWTPTPPRYHRCGAPDPVRDSGPVGGGHRRGQGPGPGSLCRGRMVLERG
jgi:hypothetical protein